MLWSAHVWTCVERFVIETKLDDKQQKNSHSSQSKSICPVDRRAELQPVVDALRAIPYLDVTDSTFFATVRLDSEYSSEAGRNALFSDILQSIRYPILMRSDWNETSYLLGEGRSEEHTSELQSLMRNSYTVFCLKKQKTT